MTEFRHKGLPNVDIDATGLLCPQPLLQLKMLIQKKSVGDQVCIAVTDEHAQLDFQVWCERFGHQLAGPIEIPEHLEQLDRQLFMVTKG